MIITCVSLNLFNSFVGGEIYINMFFFNGGLNEKIVGTAGVYFIKYKY